MAKQTINLGSTPNKGDGDPLRLAFDKVNNNFNELYAGNFASPEDTASNIIPSTDGVYDLGSFDKKWSTVHVDSFIYLNGARIEVTASGALLINGDAPAEVQDTVGSVFGDDSTLLVDGVNSSINLDGTVKGNIVPDTDVTYDLGSATNRFRDLYLSGSTIDLGGTTISVVGGELQLGGVKIPTQTDLDTAVSTPTGDVVGSVFADDSTLLVDAVAGKIVGPIEATTITSASYIDAGSVNADIYGAKTLGSFINFGTNASVVNMSAAIDMQTFSIGNAGTITATQFNGTNISVDGVASFEDIRGNLTGSVFGDDSSVLIDGVAGKIVGDVETNSLTVGGTGFVNLNNDAQNDTFYGGATTDKAILLLKGADYLAGSDDGGGVTIQGGSARNDGDNGDVTIASGNGGATGTGSVAIIADNILGLTANEISVSGKFKNPLFADIIGSVFADDSTLLVDGVAGKITGDVVTTSITNSRDIDIASEDDVAIITSAGNNDYEWFFNSGGYLSFPTNGELHFDGDAGIVFSTAYDVAGSTAHINITDTGSTANLSIDNDAANGTIDITANGSVTIATDDDGTRYEFNFGADGSLTLPGAVVSTPDTSTGGANSGTATALDVTKTLQVLNSADGDDDWWVLADGTEGQIMYFVPGTGAGTNQHKVTIENWRRWDSGAGDAGEWVVETNLDWLPFKLDFDGTRWTGVATAIFTDGAWQTNNPWID